MRDSRSVSSGRSGSQGQGIPVGANFADYLARAGQYRPDDPALIEGEGLVNWAQLDRAAADLAVGLL